MLKMIEEYAITTLPLDLEVERLASEYLIEGIVPEKYIMDGIHIAVATVKILILSLAIFQAYSKA
ncbi:MAG: hypothetical protein LIP23_01465 [Planctomycetes bacterium]|nr:hypothetical protein [Planctomycetota bacterium]